jgi:hypothetical protein
MAILSEANSVLAFTVNFFGNNSSGFQPEYHMNVFPMHATCSVHFIILNFIIIYEYLLVMQIMTFFVAQISPVTASVSPFITHITHLSPFITHITHLSYVP